MRCCRSDQASLLWPTGGALDKDVPSETWMMRQQYRLHHTDDQGHSFLMTPCLLVHLQWNMYYLIGYLLHWQHCTNITRILMQYIMHCLQSNVSTLNQFNALNWPASFRDFASDRCTIISIRPLSVTGISLISYGDWSSWTEPSNLSFHELMASTGDTTRGRWVEGWLDIRL